MTAGSSPTDAGKATRPFLLWMTQRLNSNHVLTTAETSYSQGARHSVAEVRFLVSGVRYRLSTAQVAVMQTELEELKLKTANLEPLPLLQYTLSMFGSC